VIAARRMLEEVIASLRGVIAPAISAPYPKTQAYMAAVILETLSRAIEERSDLAEARKRSIEQLFADLGELGAGVSEALPDGEDEARLARLVEVLYTDRERLGEERFAAANRRVRQTLRDLLDADLKIASSKE
jgi:predicted transcriptional regulator